MRGGDELFRVCARRVAESHRETVRNASQRTARRRYRALPVFEASVPLSARLPFHRITAGGNRAGRLTLSSHPPGGSEDMKRVGRHPFVHFPGSCDAPIHVLGSGLHARGDGVEPSLGCPPASGELLRFEEILAFLHRGSSIRPISAMAFRPP